MPNTLGTVTKSVFLIEVPSDEVHLEFTVAANKTVKAGQPLELDSAGKVQPVTVATTQTTYIGIALQDRTDGEFVTVATVGLCVIWGEAKGAQDAGPVKYDSFNGTSGYLVYDGAGVTAVNQQGWALDSAANAGDVIRILVKE